MNDLIPACPLCSHPFSPLTCCYQTEFGPANVTVNVALHKILDVDLYGGTLKLAVWLRVEWHDPRLTWDAKKWNVTKMWFMNPQQGDTEIWEVSENGGAVFVCVCVCWWGGGVDALRGFGFLEGEGVMTLQQGNTEIPLGGGVPPILPKCPQLGNTCVLNQPTNPAVCVVFMFAACGCCLPPTA